MPKQRWSPLSCIPTATLAQHSGLLVPEPPDDEVETLVTPPNVQLRIPLALPIITEGSTKSSDTVVDDDKNNNHAANDHDEYSDMYEDRDDNLTLIVTTHRLVFIYKQPQPQPSSSSKSNNKARSMDLSLLQRAQTSGSSYFKSPKIILTTESYGEVLLVFPDSRMRDQTLTKIDLSLRRKAWERQQQQQPQNKQQTPKGSGSRPSQTGSGSVGVAAIIARNKRRNEEAKALSKSAFGDFEGLLQRARDVQRVIEKYSATLDKDKQKNSSNNNSDYDSSTEDEIKLTNMLRGMGMATNAVTKSSAGSTSMYHEQLARQLADFLSRSGALQSSGGIMTLVDVYCLYNRARGTNLISPDDLLSVVELLQTLQLGMSKRKFPSGVVVIQADDHDDELMAKKLRELSLNNGGVTALFASQHFKINLILATELLLAAERLEYLCRDSTLESLMFFPNRFFLDGW